MLPFVGMLLGGGIATKVMTAVLVGGLLFTGAKCTSVQLDLNKANKEVARLSTDNAQLIVNNATLKSNVEKAADANASTVEANRLLLEERSKAQALIAELSKRQQKQKADLAAANKKIDDMVKDPKNEGSVAPVLRETLRDIQKRGK